MFTRPHSEPGQPFPDPPIGTPEFANFLEGLGVPPNATEEPLLHATYHALYHWVEGTESFKQNHATPLRETPLLETFKSIGLVEAIPPLLPTYNHVLIDGGTKETIDYRLRQYLGFVESGSVACPDVVLYGGQSLHVHTDAEQEKLLSAAKARFAEADPWLQQWLSTELRKNPSHPNPWQRPFASEHQAAVLALLDAVGEDLRHTQTILYDTPAEPAAASIPPSEVMAECFEARGVKYTVLNAPAIIRNYAGVDLPACEARPTAVSCYKFWLGLNPPETSAKVLLFTHNPNVYRSLFDLVKQAGHLRPDLTLHGAGGAAERSCSYANVLRAIGKVIFVMYKVHYNDAPLSLEGRPPTTKDLYTDHTAQSTQPA